MEDSPGATKGEDWLKGALTNANQESARSPWPPSRSRARGGIRHFPVFASGIKRARSFDLARD